MAGTYDDVPGHRFDLGADGTALYTWNSTDYAQTRQPAGALTNLSELDPAAVDVAVPVAPNGRAWFAFVFPSPRSIRGLFFHVSRINDASFVSSLVEVSADTPDGVTGTWTTLGANGARLATNTTPPAPNFRSAIGQVTADNVRCLRLRLTETGGTSGRTMNLRLAHLYGRRATEGVDRLAFWHPTLDQELPGNYFDFGDVARGVVTGPRGFRIKNLSTAKTATAVKVRAGSTPGNNGVGASGLQVAAGPGLWGDATAAFDLPPRAISAVHHARLALTNVNLATPQPRAGKLSTMGGFA